MLRIASIEKVEHLFRRGFNIDEISKRTKLKKSMVKRILQDYKDLSPSLHLYGEYLDRYKAIRKKVESEIAMGLREPLSAIPCR
jgi:hypothetical protein